MGRIPEETIQQILAATDIVDLIESYFPLKRAGSNFRALCPFHTEKSPSFNVNPARQSFHCFGCGAGGTAIRFVMDYDGLPFPEAVRKLAGRAGITIEPEEFNPEVERASRLKGRLLDLHREVAAWFHRLLFKDPVADGARAYLKTRGIDMETARHWQLGYAPESSDFIRSWARGNGLPEDLLVHGGLLSPREEGDPSRGTYCRFRDRLMFPIADDFGQVIAFSGRLLDPEVKAAKYVNSPETILFNKSRTLYGFDKTKRDILREHAVIVCEGQLDLIACFANGIRNVVAPLGTAFTEQHARILKRHAEKVILCFDSDSAGFKAADRAFGELAKVDLIPRVAEMPTGEDPDSIIKAGGVAQLKSILENAKEFLDFQIDHKGAALDLDSLGDRMQFARDVADSVALVGNKMLREYAIHKVASRLGIPAQEFRDTVHAASRKNSGETRRTVATPDRTVSGPPAAPIQIRNQTVLYLCKALLTDPGVRARLLETESSDLLKEIPETRLLTKIWNAAFDAGNPASVASFLATLPPPEESFLSNLLHEHIPEPDDDSIYEWLQKIRIRSLENRLEEKKSVLNRPGLSPAEKMKLLKEVLDLKTRLTDISPFAPSKS